GTTPGWPSGPSRPRSPASTRTARSPEPAASTASTTRRSPCWPSAEMTSIGGAYHDGQQLLELLAVVSECSDEESAAHNAVERAAQAVEAEVAVVVIDGEVAAVVGFPAGRVPHDDLISVARREVDNVDVPGVGRCHAVVADWGGGRPGHLVLARWG